MSALPEGIATSNSSNRLPSQLGALPILILNVHSQCNCRCVMCDIWKRETNTQIRAADLERHRSSLHNLGVRHVVFSGGEPLLHTDLAALCNFFREQTIRLTLLTTALLLLKRAGDVAALFDDVIISIDGPKEIHDSIRRVNGAYDLIQKGIAALRQHRSTIPITCRCTVQKANHRHLRATVTAAKMLHLDSISFLAADLTSVAFNRPLVWPSDRQSEIALNVKEVTALEDEVEQLIADHTDDINLGYIAETPAKLRRLPRHFREHLGHVLPQSPTCNAPWVSAVVEVDGSVRPCFFHRPIGNLSSDTLEEAVNGEVAQIFRQSLDIATNPTCQRCVCSLNL
jgi:MoaA/NifB/PqqE/SkfB family radical SAM enzyme